MAKLITVFGAAGKQGGGVVRALVDKPGEFKVRGVSRNIESDVAKELKQIGVEMVEASYDDAASIERAMEGAHGVFAVTIYEVLDPDIEEQQGKRIVDAAKKAGVKHLVFSSLQNITEISGKSCLPMDSKAKVEKYMFASGVPATAVWYTFYYDNIMTFYKPRKVAENEYIWDLPMEGQPMTTICLSTAGAAVAAIFRDPEGYIGKGVSFASDIKTIPEYCDIVNKYICPKKLVATTMTAEEYGNHIPDPMKVAAFFEMEQKGLLHDTGDIKRLTSEIISFEDYVRLNKDAIMAMLQDLK